MRLILVICTILGGSMVLSNPVQAQEKKTEKSSAALRTVNVRGVVKQIRPEEEQYDGTTYLSEDWSKGTIELSGGRVMEEQLFRYDANAQKLVMILEGSDKPQFVNEGLVKEFIWKDAETGNTRRFIDPEQFSLPRYPKGGFLEVVYMGEDYGVYKHHSVYLREPTYTPGITVTKKNKAWVKKDDILLYSNKKYQELPNSRRRKEKLFEEEGIDLKKCNLKEYDHKEVSGLKSYFECIGGKEDAKKDDSDSK